MPRDLLEAGGIDEFRNLSPADQREIGKRLTAWERALLKQALAGRGSPQPNKVAAAVDFSDELPAKPDREASRFAAHIHELRPEQLGPQDPTERALEEVQRIIAEARK